MNPTLLYPTPSTLFYLHNPLQGAWSHQGALLQGRTILRIRRRRSGRGRECMGELSREEVEEEGGEDGEEDGEEEQADK